MSFAFYLETGLRHILDLNGYDHILFVVALCAVYRPQQWRPLLVLVTAFTVGHSLTLALAALKLIVLPTEVIEFLIPVTIFLTAVYNFRRGAAPTANVHRWLSYGLALGFGLIHGVGFSNYFRSLLGREADITLPLFAFNLGLEVGQIVIVSLTLFIGWLLVQKAGLNQRYWTYGLSGFVAAVALYLMQQTVFW
jgi:hypothetical protein